MRDLVCKVWRDIVQNKINSSAPPENTTSTESNKQQNTLTVKIDGMRLAIEIIVVGCLIVNAVMIWFADKVSTSVSWSLLTLCITTFSTLIQFQNEAQWKYRGNFAFHIPFWGIIIAILMIIMGFVVDPVAIITQHRIFVDTVSVLITFRQILHTAFIYKLFMHGKGNTN